jgi:outer membrane protein insertion porin family
LHKIRVIALATAVITAFLFSLPSFGQGSNVIEEVVVQGGKRIESETVRSYLLLQAGDLFDKRRIDQSLKSLYATGLFADVMIRQEGKLLIVQVVENPIINRIAFEGAERVEEADLRNELVLRSRVVFTRTKVQADVKRLLEVYRVNGRFSAVIIPKIIKLPQNRADLVFEINEGPLTTVERVSFVGNRYESDSDLRGIVRSKQTRWYRFWSNDDTYDPDRLALDRELLRRHYLAKGFANFRVESAIGELTPGGKAFFITYSINEGERYKFGNISVAADIKGLDSKVLAGLVGFEKGDLYNNKKIDGAIDSITDAVGDRGFAFVEIRPRVERDRKNKQVNVEFSVREGPRVFVERIEITGNVRTIDSVIRRETQISEGDAFNASKLRRGRQRIQDLDFFNKVEFQREAGSAPDKAVIKVDVEEKSTGALSFGLGYSTDVGALIDVGLKERNLLGKGQQLEFNGSVAGEKSTGSVSFTEPYFMGRNVAAGIDVYHSRQEFQASSSYDSKKTGLGLRTGYPLTEELRQNLRYKIEAAEIRNVSSDASRFVKSEAGSRTLSEVGHTLSYNELNSRINPTGGYRLTMNNDVAGLGGNVRYFKNKVKAVQYSELFPKWVFSVKGAASHIYGINQDVKISDRFVLGGGSLRGFANMGVGPRDISSDDSLGGEWMYNGSAQVTFPIGLPVELGITGRLFSDFGSIGEVNPKDVNVKDSGSVRVSAGTGLGWVSPFGPINIDLAWTLIEEDYDKTERFRFNFGSRF